MSDFVLFEAEPAKNKNQDRVNRVQNKIRKMIAPRLFTPQFIIEHNAYVTHWSKRVVLQQNAITAQRNVYQVIILEIEQPWVIQE
jgi:hypothetical protein